MVKRRIGIALLIVSIVSLISGAYGLVAFRVFQPDLIFNSNYVVGAVILIGGLLLLAKPTAMLIKKSPLIDHTTYGQKVTEKKTQKRNEAFELIYVGVLCILIAALFQLAVWLIF